MKFYAVTQKSTSVTLCWPNGKVYKRIYTSEDKTQVFPAADVNNREGDMILGWSRRKGKTTDQNMPETGFQVKRENIIW